MSILFRGAPTRGALRKIVEWRVSYHYMQRRPAASLLQEVHYTTRGGFVWAADTTFREIEEKLLYVLHADVSMDPAVRLWAAQPVGTWRYAQKH